MLKENNVRKKEFKHIKLSHTYDKTKKTIKECKPKRRNTPCFLDFVDVSFDMDVCSIAFSFSSMLEMDNGKFVAL